MLSFKKLREGFLQGGRWPKASQDLRGSWHACVVTAGVNPSGKTMMAVDHITPKTNQIPSLMGGLRILIYQANIVQTIVDNNQGNCAWDESKTIRM